MMVLPLESVTVTTTFGSASPTATVPLMDVAAGGWLFVPGLAELLLPPPPPHAAKAAVNATLDASFVIFVL